MAYCTLADLTERFGADEIDDLAPGAVPGTFDQALIERVLEDAAGEIDGYVSAAGYPVPLSPVPRIVTAYACDLARYRLYDDQANDQVTKRYDDAVKFLRAVARGEVKLGVAADDASDSAGSVQFQHGSRVMPGGGF